MATQNKKDLIELADRTTHNLGQLLRHVSFNPAFDQSNHSQTVTQTMGNIDHSTHSIATGDISNSGNLALGEIQGQVSQAIDRLHTTPTTPNAEALAKLLEELQGAIATDITTQPNLSKADQTEALAQVQILAEAGQNPDNPDSQKSAKRATRILKGIAHELPNVAAIAKSCETIVPAILSLFGS